MNQDNLIILLKSVYDINNYQTIRNKASCDYMKKDDVMNVLLSKLGTRYGYNELEMIYYMLKDEWTTEKTIPSSWLFNIFAHFTYNLKVLKLEGHKPYVRFENIDKWRSVSFHLGQDELVTAYLAYKDKKETNNFERTFFSWRPIIFSDNKRIHRMLKEGVSDLHSHLKGAGPYFELSWLSLMNNASKNTQGFKKLLNSNKLVPDSVYKEKENRGKSLEEQVYMASIIRYILYCRVIEHDNTDSSNLTTYIDQILRENINLDLLKKICYSLSNDIETELTENSKEYYEYDTKYFVDYIIPKEMNEINYEGSNKYNGYTFFYGERYLLYQCFKKFYRNADNKQDKYGIMTSVYKKLFMIYVTAKHDLRKEMVQINDLIGFANFAEYQNRKTYFLDKVSIYYKALCHLAVRTSFINEYSVIEVRIAPDENPEKFRTSVENYIDYIESPIFYEKLQNTDKVNDKALYIIKNDRALNKVNYFFGVHFLKEPNKNLKNFLEFRHYKKRKEVMKQARAIVYYKKETAFEDKLKLLDAANNELLCRPEVFGHAYRFVRQSIENMNLELQRDYLYEEYKRYQQKEFGYSFHVGEDFYDIVDGLRAIEESRYFLNLGEGCRLGHATVLGLDVYEFYKKKNYIMLIDKQCLLDNICWLLSKCRKYNIETDRFRERLSRLFHEHYECVYGEISDNVNLTMNNYYDAWKLRGDDPEMYRNVKLLNKKISIEFPQNLQEQTSLNYYTVDFQRIRDTNTSAKYLYHSYHFDKKVKIKGAQGVQFHVNHDYIKAIEELQAVIRTKIKNNRIGIEINPSSNFLISSISNYSQHPVIKFYNLGLTYDSAELSNCEQLLVSINTDDKGVFGTNIENEYAILAVSLEKNISSETNSRYNQEMIYDWLDRIRKMGLEQATSKCNRLL